MAECNEFLDDLEELVTCGICNDILVIPKTFVCLHTFCLKCLEQWQQHCQVERKPFNCPTCRASIHVEADNVNNLPTSFHHNSMIELLKNFKEKKAYDDEEFSMPCCSSCSNRRVVAGCCFQCGGMLCNQCYKDKNTEIKAEQHIQYDPVLPLHQRQMFLHDGADLYRPQYHQQTVRPFFNPKIQHVRPRWNIQQQQQLGRGIPVSNGGAIPKARTVFQVRPRRMFDSTRQKDRRQKNTYAAHGTRLIQPAYFTNVPVGQLQTHLMHRTDQEPHLPTALATASPQEAKQMLGERLYPIVGQSYPELSGKITGMLLELPNSELLNMLESREALDAKVEEAIDVLVAHQAKDFLPNS